MDKDFKELRIWQAGRELRNELFDWCKRLPADERYRLADQVIRASRSVTANIAEGYGRYHYKETLQYGRQSRGSLYELLDHIDVAVSCGYIDKSTAKYLDDKIHGTIKGLNAYLKYIKNQQPK